MATTKKMTRLEKLLDKYKACVEGREWALQHKTPSAAWLACSDQRWMLWAIESLGLNDDRRLRLFACACVSETPLADGRKVWDLLTDDRSRNAVEVAERFADGKATQEELSAAESAAESAAASAAESSAASAAWSAWSASAASAAAWSAWSASAAAWSAWSASAAAEEAAESAARSAAEEAQCDIIRRIWGNPFAKQER